MNHDGMKLLLETVLRTTLPPLNLPFDLMSMLAVTRFSLESELKMKGFRSIDEMLQVFDGLCYEKSISQIAEDLGLHDSWVRKIRAELRQTNALKRLHAELKG